MLNTCSYLECYTHQDQMDSYSFHSSKCSKSLTLFMCYIFVHDILVYVFLLLVFNLFFSYYYTYFYSLYFNHIIHWKTVSYSFWKTVFKKPLTSCSNLDWLLSSIAVPLSSWDFFLLFNWVPFLFPKKYSFFFLELKKKCTAPRIIQSRQK